MISSLAALRVAVAGLLTMAPAWTAGAQTVGATAVEGHAFNAETLKPLKNVRIVIDLSDASHTVGVSAITDAHGFYSVAFDPTTSLADITAVSPVASCVVSQRRVIDVPFSLYTALRPIVYQRNVYLRLPRGVTRCQ